MLYLKTKYFHSGTKQYIGYYHYIAIQKEMSHTCLNFESTNGENMILFNDLIAVLFLFSFDYIHCFLLLLNLFINSMFLFEYMIKLHLRKKTKKTNGYH